MQHAPIPANEFELHCSTTTFTCKLDDAIASYLCSRDQHVTPKQGFAVDSDIRLIESLAYAA